MLDVVHRDEPFWRLYESWCGHRSADGVPFKKGPPPVRIRTT
jgi:hypothetical protein